jgi:hypothetical protein
MGKTGSSSTSCACKKKSLVFVFKHVLKSLKKVRLQMWFDGEVTEFMWKLAMHKVTVISSLLSHYESIK